MLTSFTFSLERRNHKQTQLKRQIIDSSLRRLLACNNLSMNISGSLKYPIIEFGNSLLSKRFRANWKRKLGREQKIGIFRSETLSKQADLERFRAEGWKLTVLPLVLFSFFLFTFLFFHLSFPALFIFVDLFSLSRSHNSLKQTPGTKWEVLSTRMLQPLNTRNATFT